MNKDLIEQLHQHSFSVSQATAAPQSLALCARYGQNKTPEGGIVGVNRDSAVLPLHYQDKSLPRRCVQADVGYSQCRQSGLL